MIPGIRQLAKQLNLYPEAMTVLYWRIRFSPLVETRAKFYVTIAGTQRPHRRHLQDFSVVLSWDRVTHETRYGTNEGTKIFG
jgi:hypothetical protein